MAVHDIRVSGNTFPYKDTIKSTFRLRWKGKDWRGRYRGGSPLMPRLMAFCTRNRLILEIDGESIEGAIRDTVYVPKGGSCRIAFEANNPGVWAFHCHIAYHYVRGMFNVVAYRSADLSWWNPSAFSHEYLPF